MIPAHRVMILILIALMIGNAVQGHWLVVAALVVAVPGVIYLSRRSRRRSRQSK